MVGAPTDSDTAYSSGSVYIFTYASGVWSPSSRLPNPVGSMNYAYFGTSVALSNDGKSAVVGANGVGGNGAGAAWVFSYSGSSWDAGTQLTPAISLQSSSLYGKYPVTRCVPV